MEYQKFGQRYVVRFNQGEEIIQELTQFATTEHITLASIQALGACDSVTMGLYDLKKKQYHSKTLQGDMEITSLLGSITMKDSLPYLHLHIQVADENQQVWGGHLNECIISATLEMFVDVIEGEVLRELDEITGLNLLKFNQK